MNVYFDMVTVFAKKAWTWVQSYWKIGFILVMILVAGLLFEDTKNVEKQYQDKLNQQKSFYQSQMQIIQDDADREFVFA